MKGYPNPRGQYHREPRFSLSAILVLRVEGGEIAELTTLSAELCGSFRLPLALD